VEGDQQEWSQRAEDISRPLARPTGLGRDERTELEIELMEIERLIARYR
jgi:hypothetical protein